MLLIIFASETNPFVIDAYLMLQDIVMLIGADQPIFMTGIVEMTRTFGLELLESLLTKFPAVFEKHDQVRCWHQLAVSFVLGHWSLRRSLEALARLRHQRIYHQRFWL